MMSPFVRRHRLAAKLRTLREEREMTADELAKGIHYSRTKISRLENAYGRPDVGDVITVLDALDVAGPEWEEIVRLARDASSKGWWDRFGDSMGSRQKLYADLEAGAATVRDYSPTGIPAVLQTPEFIDALVKLDKSNRPIRYTPARMTEARRQRQLHFLRPDGPTYDTVLDEFVILRLDVHADVMIKQLRHMVDIVSAEERLTVRFLRYNARITGGLLPKSSVALYTFPADEDPAMAVVETVTNDLVHTDPEELARYDGDYKRLQEAALAPEESLAFLSETADRLANEMRQRV
ncbi:helix-turn-helix transcriptional regulator [Actinomadura sp. 7K507]|uniref:helix-turn-helix domain-containing protein n=1 Tax=Actinomadura sp. 7K507 TaxID=2530365 RepID=UPI0010504341|nr:helix-turn-helix transcriptional regulator [Actinomadura sp. 7K507]TDC97715.1 XRE family transcriptional regulator [Actinomadura sp. 7K507]